MSKVRHRAISLPCLGGLLGSLTVPPWRLGTIRQPPIPSFFFKPLSCLGQREWQVCTCLPALCIIGGSRQTCFKGRKLPVE